jgi:5-deoxy-glucuronate isomerase
MQIRHQVPFARGTTPLVERRGATADMLMDFGVVVMDSGEKLRDVSATDERTWLLVHGTAHLVWDGGSADIRRESLFDQEPWCLLAPSGCAVSIEAGSEGAEFYRCATDNPKQYAPRIFTPADCQSEMRGAGTMNETSTRVVRTIFDDRNMKDSNLVIGEVIGVPGKWSSYPPHHHRQPEIYHYRFLPEQGFGLTRIGDTPYLIRERDTILIRDGEDHPQVTAPGYAMWYLWVIRHLDGDRYGIQTFTEAHKWVGEVGAKIWAPTIK